MSSEVKVMSTQNMTESPLTAPRARLLNNRNQGNVSTEANRDRASGDKHKELSEARFKQRTPLQIGTNKNKDQIINIATDSNQVMVAECNDPVNRNANSSR